ncbi:hypothetical protein [Thalassobellus sediminis]|uniref:hypothetical protein n=1 Tax=Thalassobellus sediminis TaxID=3367753 RepID=UPI00378BE617
MGEVNSEQSKFEEFENIEVRRRMLLPWWVKIFCWIFMLFGLLAFVCLILGFVNIRADLSFYGFETNEQFSLIGLMIIAIGVFKGFTAFSLWLEKDYAIKMGKIDAIIGIVICTISMLVLPFFQEGFNISIRLELALLIPFFIKLNKIQNVWKSLN